MNKKKEKVEAAVDILSKLLKNIIDNPSEEKFRMFRKENATIKEKLTMFKSGVDLAKLLGFQEVKDETTKEVVYRINSNASISFIKVRTSTIKFFYREGS